MVGIRRPRIHQEHRGRRKRRWSLPAAQTGSDKKKKRGRRREGRYRGGEWRERGR